MTLPEISNINCTAIDCNTISLPAPNFFYSCYTNSGFSKDIVSNELKILTGNLKNLIKLIKENHWENEEEIINFMNEINKLSLEC